MIDVSPGGTETLQGETNQVRQAEGIAGTMTRRARLALTSLTAVDDLKETSSSIDRRAT